MTKLRVRVFPGATPDVDTAQEDLTVICAPGDWDQHLTLRVPGFDGYASLNVADVWARFHKNNRKPTVGQATARETIVKFGGTKQLKTLYTVAIDWAPSG